MRSLLLVFAIGCSTTHSSALSANDCDHVWGDLFGATACCRTQNDCNAAGQSMYQCAPDGAPLGMGICPQPTCDVDADCRGSGATQICEELACMVPGSTQTGWCVAGCTTDATCAEGESCDLAGNRCHPSACTTTGQCPIDFTCANGTCTRSACTSDRDCNGFCVLGQCYLFAGECRGPVG